LVVWRSPAGSEVQHFADHIPAFDVVDGARSRQRLAPSWPDLS
jgi:hypothetical protein